MTRRSANRKKSNPATKLQLRLWEGESPKIVGNRYVGLLFSRDYEERPSLNRALPAATRRHPTAHVATIRLFRQSAGMWFAVGDPELIPLKTDADRLAKRCMDVIDRAVAEGVLPG